MDGKVFFGGVSFDNGNWKIEQYYRIEHGKRRFYFQWTYPNGAVKAFPMRKRSSDLAERWLAKHMAA